MRILITGSRDWDDAAAIGNALAALHPTDAQGFDLPGPKPVLVSGACPTGADRSAEIAARFLGWTVERHPADWSRGRKAGPERNAAMVELGADLCLAFIGDCTSPRCHRPDPHPSHGASGCADLAEEAGIRTRRIFADGTER